MFISDAALVGRDARRFRSERAEALLALDELNAAEC